MLTLRTEQMRLLAEPLAADFERALARHIASHFPDVAQRGELSGFVRQACRKAATYGLSGSRDVVRFVNLCAAFGIDFDERPANTWMRDILLDATVSSPSERLRVLTATCLHRAAVEEHNARVTRPALPALPVWLQ